MSSSGRTSFARANRGNGPHHIIISRGALVCTFKVHQWLAWTAGVGGILFFALYIAATGYWVFRDDILAASIARQSRIRFVYEDRIAELRAQIDRVTSRQLLEQEAIDAKMQRLLGRQAALDARQDLLAGLDSIARNLGVAPTADGQATGVEAGVDPVGTGATSRPGERADSIVDAPLRESRLFDAVADDPEERLGAVELTLDAMEKQQTAFVEAVAAKVTAKAARINTVIARLGHKLDALPAEGGVGGPFLPVADGPRSFRQGIAEVTDGIEQLAALRTAARHLPLWRPLPGAAVTSGYGARLDPFLHRPSLHAGVDFRSEPGTAVQATARGTVIEAGPTGGYGNMVEVDHGNGLTTRYAHLSAISVKVGDAVKTGDAVGFVGTTGRSTGPHLHYEVRVEGEPIDPMRYIKAGGELRGILSGGPPLSVTPAKAGAQSKTHRASGPDSGFRWNDDGAPLHARHSVRHPGEGRGPEQNARSKRPWIPASAGMTMVGWRVPLPISPAQSRGSVARVLPRQISYAQAPLRRFGRARTHPAFRQTGYTR